MSNAVPEKSPQIAFVQFDAQKAGGIVRIPTEIDADSIVPMGQFIARYGARNLARWEDTVFFNADGSWHLQFVERRLQERRHGLKEGAARDHQDQAERHHAGGPSHACDRCRTRQPSAGRATTSIPQWKHCSLRSIPRPP
jgi:hypothetical protein